MKNSEISKYKIPDFSVLRGIIISIHKLEKEGTNQLKKREVKQQEKDKQNIMNEEDDLNEDMGGDSHENK